MTDRFLKCVSVILKNEGGAKVVNDPHDPGGLTKYGISKRSWPNIDIENLTEEEAKQIYYAEYWLPIKVEALVDENAALQIFDMAVNAGVTRAVRMAQHCAKAYEDGIMGMGTIQAINNSECFVERYKTSRIKYYASLKNADRYLKGWTRRVVETKL